MGQYDLQANALSVMDVSPQQISSDAVTGAGAPIDGYNYAHLYVSLDAFLDSDTQVTITVQKNTVTNVATDAVASDWGTLKAISAFKPSGDSDTTVMKGYWIDLVKHGLTTGLLRTSTIASASDTANMSSLFIFTRASGRLPDTSSDQITWAEIAT